MKKLLLLFFCALLPSALVLAQSDNTYKGAIRFTDFSFLRNNDNLSVSFLLNLDDVKLSSDKMITFTPVLVSADSAHSYVLDPVVVSGKNRMKYLKRTERLKKRTPEAEKEPVHIVLRKNGTVQNVPVHADIPFQDWMSGVNLIVDETVTGCYSCEPSSKSYLVEAEILKADFQPLYQVVYVTPAVEAVKRRSEVYRADLSFQVAKHDLLTDYKDNSAKLEKVNQIISTVKGDSLLTITSIETTGYASPEGNYSSNMKLSENRARVFSNYLRDKYMLVPSLIEVNWKGEDWSGLRSSVKASTLADKDRIIEIIDQVTDMDDRKAQIRALSSGRTYQTLLSEYYPPLRRNEYRISYIIEPLSIAQARDLIKTKPNYLSLNEMYLVANSYPKDSKEFRDVFDIALKVYPEDEIARLNAASAELENKNADAAIALLTGLASVEALNNLGVAYIQKGMNFEAEICFRKAAQKGLTEGRSNLIQYERWKQEND